MSRIIFQKAIVVFAAIISLLFFTPADVAAEQSEHQLVLQRARFTKAIDAFSNDQIDSFNRYKSRLKSYPLYPYLEYLSLKSVLKKSKQTRLSVESKQLLNQYLSKYSSSYYARRLTGIWQRNLAQQQRWRAYLALTRTATGVKQQCLKLQALVGSGQLRALNGLAEEIWTSGRPAKKSCVAALLKLEKSAPPSINLIWQRIRNAINRGNIQYASKQNKYLNSRDKTWLTLLIDGYKTPEKTLAFVANKPPSEIKRRVIIRTLKQWANKDLDAAYKYWQRHKKTLLTNTPTRWKISRSLALKAAYRRRADAYKWLVDLPSTAQNLAVKKWTILSALYQTQWDNVIRHIQALPDVEQKKLQWQFWYARALDELGYKQEAGRRYQSLSQSANYYGFLAADKISSNYAITQKTSRLDEVSTNTLLSRPAFLRTREYFAVNLITEARREWRSAIKGLSASELKRAAFLAHTWGWHSQAISTIAKTPHRQHLDLRFPTPYDKNVIDASQRFKLETNWIYGVMRRESAFTVDIRSHSGAIGLMQIMPATAQFVAKKQGTRIKTTDLTRADINIPTGAYYLRHVLDRFDNNRVLATAAYNAGPNRVERWLPEGRQLPADVWIDTIPFGETRRYVRAVLAYSLIFDWRKTGQPTPLKTYMQNIPARLKPS